MKNKMFLVIVILAVVLIVTAGVVVVLLMNKQAPKDVPIVYHEFVLDEAYSNLADANSKKIVKYGVIIQYTDEKLLDVLTKNTNKIMNNIDEIMRTTKAADIEASNGKERLRMKIQDMLIELLESDDSTITDVFLKPFVIQG